MTIPMTVPFESPAAALAVPVTVPLAVPLAVALAAAAGALVPVGSAYGQDCTELLRVRFVEGAPRDRFELEVGADPGGAIEALGIDLAGAAGGLVFDTEAGGDGVEVFQPFRQEAGSDGVELFLAGFGGDGATRIDLIVAGAGPGARFAFSIDLDDTLMDSSLGNIRVDGAEIAGATVTLGIGGDGARVPATGAFDADAVAIVCR